MASSVVALDKVDLVYRTRDSAVQALTDVSLTAAPGEFLAIVGPSGCGKSSLLKLISGLLKPSAGHVRFEGAPVIAPPPGIGIVFQNALLMPWRTILENVLVQFDMRGLPSKGHVEEARSLLAMTGLSAFESSYPYQLSGGMQQRVGICRALVHAPHLLIMDEPFGALDAMTREQMMIELQRIWMERQTTVLFITHSMAEAVFLADRVIVMGPRPGRVVDEVIIDLPRPRRVREERSAAYAHYADRLRSALEQAGALAH
jgi:NitT/TauT family transport system ATP-binding protein